MSALPDLDLDPASRRAFLKTMGASIALAGLSACARQPIERIVPYVVAPETIVPGKSLYYATAFPFRGYGMGILAESVMGRPIKIEGNPGHPASLGATNVFAQASVLTLWDPERSQTVTESGRIRTWDDAARALRLALRAEEPFEGAGLRLLTGTITSPTLAEQIGALLQRFPRATWHQYEPVGGDAARAGVRAAFGRDAALRYRFDRAEVILSLDSDCLYAGPGSVRDARDFALARRVRAPERTAMSRMYAAEVTPTVTGSAADHRLPARSDTIAALLDGLAGRLLTPEREAPALGEIETRWLEAVTRDLEAHRGAGLVVVGEHQSEALHLLAHAVNDALGNLGRTLLLTEPVEARPEDHAASLRSLAAAIDAGAVRALLVLGENPAYAAPAALRFAERLAHVPATFHLGLYEDETARACRWHIPESHPLEAWSDLRAWDGSVTIQQPLIAPLFGGRSAHEVLAAALGETRSAHDRVKDRFVRASAGGWEKALKDGVVAGTEAATITPRVDAARVRAALLREQPASAGSLELAIRPDPNVWDGRYARNAWLQELPKPLTKLTWDNAALVAPRTAARLGLENGDVVKLEVQGERIEAPVWIQPGQAPDAVTVHLGYGRGAGFDAYRLVGGTGLALSKAGRRTELAVTHTHHTMEGRDLARAGTLGAFVADPGFLHRPYEPVPAELSLYPAVPYPGHAWSMSLDTSACIGCNACVVACQAENNIPVVGKDQVLRGREMHWIRIDRYYEGSADAPKALHMPVPCMHCEDAPCEAVCPVGATVHSHEGLNQMVYNRCIGTRYCSNNCPYKVRRFNFFHYADATTPARAQLYNPDVTVRGRGVMEKCTYCVQRIQEVRIAAEEEKRPIRDGDITPACAQACPTQAIVFGDRNDALSRVARDKAQPHAFALLAGLNTRPRTTYLATLRNPNPALGEDDGEPA
jgi:molybdopterin-containing oxidoreductase family iron-sulfur binding subunit